MKLSAWAWQQGLPGVALYASVSSGEQKADLDGQLSRLAEFSSKRGFRVVEAVRETGSGLHEAACGSGPPRGCN
jgi:predicted site-specific integrase-resolvase